METLEDWIFAIKNSKKTIIVEGKRDKKALEEFGIKNVITLKGRPLYIIGESIKNKKEAVILTDLDKKGKQLYSKIKKNLEKEGFKIDNKFREFLFKNTKLRQIEGLVRYLEKEN